MSKSFQDYDDVRFSDFEPTRVATKEGNERRREADNEAVWTANCAKCKHQVAGSLKTLKEFNVCPKCGHEAAKCL